MSRTVKPEIAVTVDAVIFTQRDGEEMVLLIERGNEPFQGSWALPGGFVETDEDLVTAAVRELGEETGLEVDTDALTQLGAYGRPGRDPRMRTVSIVYWGRVPDSSDPVGGSDAASSRWVPVAEATEKTFALAFDHDLILADASQANSQQ